MQDKQNLLKRGLEDEDQMFFELGKVIFREGGLQEIYAGIGLPRATKKVKLVLAEYEVVRERGLAVSKRLARYAAKLSIHDPEDACCSFCRVHLSTAGKR